MSKYVDIKTAMQVCDEFYFTDTTLSLERLFDNAPSIDIVRCKECRWRNTKRCIIHFFKEDLKDHDYCSYGEREDA